MNHLEKTHKPRHWTDKNKFLLERNLFWAERFLLVESKQVGHPIIPRPRYDPTAISKVILFLFVMVTLGLFSLCQYVYIIIPRDKHSAALRLQKLHNNSSPGWAAAEFVVKDSRRMLENQHFFLISFLHCFFPWAGGGGDFSPFLS